MKPLMMRWKPVPSKKPWRESFLKFATVFGASFSQNSATITPLEVVMTATSSDAPPFFMATALPAGFAAFAAGALDIASSADAAPATSMLRAAPNNAHRIAFRTIVFPPRSGFCPWVGRLALLRLEQPHDAALPLQLLLRSLGKGRI